MDAEARRQGEEIIGLRDELARFAINMEQQLRANDYKGGWASCTPNWLLNRLTQEVAELARVLTSGVGDPITEAADVANFAMMIADVFREE